MPCGKRQAIREQRSQERVGEVVATKGDKEETDWRLEITSEVRCSWMHNI